jgi:hypothetical protein
VVDFHCLREVETVRLRLERRYPAADTELEAAVAHLIEHANFLDQPQRMVERQEIDERTEAQIRRALRHGGEEKAWRCGTAERRRMMLGKVISVNAGAVISFDQGEAIGIELAERHSGLIHMIEDAEFHSQSPIRVVSVIPGPERSEGARNPVISDRGYWIPGAPLHGAPE